MYGLMQVLIADDEAKVCNLVQQLIDWEGLGLTLAGVVHDSESALKFIFANSPEIVITDIRMPEKGGIEMIRQVREKRIDTHFIIISGYPEFEYASRAIKYGVEDYLLKPLKQKELEKALVKIIHKQNERIASEQEHFHLVEQLSQNQGKVKSQFLAQLLAGSLSEAQLADWNHVNQTYQSHFVPGDVQLLMVRIRSKKQSEEIPSGVLLRKVRELLEAELVSAFHEALLLEQEDKLYVLLNGDHMEFSALRRKVHHIASSSQSFQDIFGPLDVLIALSQPTHQPSRVVDCVMQTEKAALQRIFLPQEQIIAYAPSFEPDQDPSAFVSPGFRVSLKKDIELFDGEGMQQRLSQLLEEIKVKQIRSGWLVKQLLDQLLALLEAAAADFGRELDPDIAAECQQALLLANSLPEAWAALQAAFAKALTTWEIEKQAEGSRPIRDAKKYINAHYQEQITLQQVSDAIGLNPTYFSGVFKRETGQNFVDYLTQVRIDAAKTLLMQTDGSIGDVAEKVGYLDMKYFYKRFKQATGLSPKEYQKLYH